MVKNLCPPLSRRRVLAAGALLPAQLLASSCRSVAGSPEPEGVGDAHAHLFNAADLPVAGFVRYVAIPSKFPQMPGWGKAMIDLFATLFKGAAVTADQESDRLRIGKGLAEISPARFGLLVANHIREQTATSPGALVDEERTELIESYRELNRAVAADSSAPAALRDTSEPSADLFAEIARKADDGALAPGDVANQKAAAGFGGGDLASAARLLGWGYLMLLSRASHLKRYRNRVRTPEFGPNLVINHLVDYDLWLDDAPTSGSDVFAQVKVMNRLAVANQDLVKLRLFAGYCPLRHAIDLTGGQPTTFDRLAALFPKGQVHGFKLYPPMGFRPFGNAALPDASFDPKETGRRTALDRWKAIAGGNPLGAALDDALARFYRTCADRGIPLMAHAARSNGAGRDYADRADHQYWAMVAARYNIRLSLGHLVDNVVPFVEAAEKGPPYPAEIWSLATAISLLDPRPTGAEAYGDIGYTQELLDQPKLAARFFTAIRKAFGKADPDLTRIMYGTDWIMLGMERQNEHYLECIVRGMRDGGLTATQQQNILSNNVRRYLRV